MKAKISVTVEEKYVDWIDSQIKTLRFRNRSHAIEYALAILLDQEQKNIMYYKAEQRKRQDLRRDGQPESIPSREHGYY